MSRREVAHNPNWTLKTTTIIGTQHIYTYTCIFAYMQMRIRRVRYAFNSEPSDQGNYYLRFCWPWIPKVIRCKSTIIKYKCTLLSQTFPFECHKNIRYIRILYIYVRVQCNIVCVWVMGILLTNWTNSDDFSRIQLAFAPLRWLILSVSTYIFHFISIMTRKGPYTLTFITNSSDSVR